ncbi:MAG TPA: Dyp-type peroxidase [Solirubrobacteraceae bacterium]|nr:Dyp-type peroxidase [Solirubrobacteraceae bacterium]
MAAAVIEVADLQGGIVRGYGSRFRVARHLFARVRDPGAARALLAGLADPVTTEEEWDSDRPSTTLNVALSFRALTALEIPDTMLDRFPDEFRCGMEHRAGRLGDHAPSWDDELRDVEVLLVVHAQSAAALDEEAGRLQRALGEDGGLELAHVQDAGLLGDQREHFGFTDGFSQPAIEGVARAQIRGQGVYEKPWYRRQGHWRAIKPGEFVLGYEDEDRGLAPAPPPPFDRNATFMVWRKLEQDVAGFRAQLADRAGQLDVDEELVAAKIVGRWRDGSPLALRPEAPDRALGYDRRRANDFRYGGDPLGLKCPRGAHIRRTNPRDALKWESRLSSRHRILRRGMPYGPELPHGAQEDGEQRGLLFVCMQASIARQFEIVQSQWCNDGNAFRLGREPDAIAGPRESTFLIGGEPPRLVSPLQSCVHCRGGEYLFVPGIAALRALPSL